MALSIFFNTFGHDGLQMVLPVLGGNLLSGRDSKYNLAEKLF